MSQYDLLAKIYIDKPFTDITFVIEGEEISGHKAILAASCKYFQTMLFGATNEATSTRITLHETPLKSFKEVIRFCYLRKINIGYWDVDEVCKLLSLAHEYDFVSLSKEIPKLILKKGLFTPASLPIFHDLAVKLNLELVHVCMAQYIQNKRELVLKSEEFVEYSVDLVCFILDAVGLYCKYDLIKSVWKRKATHTGQEVEQVFKKIRWHRLPWTALVEVIRVMIPETNLVKIAEMNPIQWETSWDPWP